MSKSNFVHKCCSLVVLLSLWSVATCRAQANGERVDIYFRQDVHEIEEDLNDNKEKLELLDSLLDRLTTDSISKLSKIEINSYTSPEPGVEYNIKLSWRRSNSLRNYILERGDIPDSMIVANGNGIAWEKMRVLVAESDMKYRDEVLEILDSIPEETWAYENPNDRWLSLVDSREKHLMDLRGGRPYKFLYDSIYPQMRYGSQVSFFYDTFLPMRLHRSYVDVGLPAFTDKPLPSASWSKRVPILAVKTNLLFDAVTALNVEVEVPIYERFSLLGEWIFPWWVASDNGSALEILSGNIEGRYWMGNRTKLPTMTGWFAGLYAGGGLYDLQWNNNGYQGEFFIAAGISAGYAHTINKSETLRLEYSLGVGYLSTNYRYYEGKRDNQYLVWQYDGKYSWLGPTRAKVSLVWMLYRTKGGSR